MKKRKLKKRIRELERVLNHEADSLTRLYTRVERLEARSRQSRWQIGTIPLDSTDSATWGAVGRDWDWFGGVPRKL